MVNVLMVGVDKGRVGGMWTVAEAFINSNKFNDKVNLYYVATSTGGSVTKRVLKMLQGYAKIFYLLLTKRIDIVHVHMAERGSVYRKGVVVKLAKIFGKKVIVQMHSGPILSWYESLSCKEQQKVSKIFVRPDLMLVLGEFWKEQMKALIPKEQIRVLYNGASCTSYNPYNPEGDIVLYLGLLKKTKGTYDLVDAVKLINEEIPQQIKVYLCGLDEKGDMLQYIKERNLQDRFVLPGWIDSNQKTELFKRTAVCVLPSYFEALSMTIIEAMCHGIPVVTTNISTMPELVGADVPLIQPGDVKALAEHIKRLLMNREMRINYSKLLYARANEQFSIEKNVEHTLQIYNDLVDFV